MSDVVLEMNDVSKKFKRGETYDSLRDLVPALLAKLVKRQQIDALKANEFWALSDVSFQVNRGEAFGIIGHNGAGKSTILKVLSGVMKPTRGILVTRGTMSALIEVGAGFHPDLTGRENVYLNGTILGMKRAEIQKKFDEIVEFSGLAEFIDTPVKRYSSGMFARLGFSVAAHVEPDILIVDEVLSVGDFSFQNKCLEKMRSILNSDATVVFVSHNLRAVSELCNRCILLDHGRIVREGPTAEVVAHYLDRERDRSREDTDNKEVFISRAVFHGQNGDELQFKAGEKAFFDVEIKAVASCRELSVSIVMVDDNYSPIFNTSTERLMHEAFSLNAGETWKCRFELNLHLAPGIYHLSTYVYRYDIQKSYDMIFPAATIYISYEKDTKGVVNLYPSITVN